MVIYMGIQAPGLENSFIHHRSSASEGRDNAVTVEFHSILLFNVGSVSNLYNSIGHDFGSRKKRKEKKTLTRRKYIQKS